MCSLYLTIYENYTLRERGKKKCLFTGEVKINIRGFIALETEERLERDIVTVAVHGNAAVGAHLFGKVKA